MNVLAAINLDGAFDMSDIDQKHANEAAFHMKNNSRDCQVQACLATIKLEEVQ